MAADNARLLRVLSIDGGGVRGLLPATILHLLEQKLQQKTNNPAARLVDFIDLVAGTSTGGILTCLLLMPGEDGKPKYTTKEILEFYNTKMPAVFQRSIYEKVTSVWGWDGPQYNAQYFEALLKEHAADVKFSELVRPCILTSYNIDTGEPFFFTNSSVKSEMPCDFYVRDVARSTSAAPTYFVPSQVSPLPAPVPASAPTLSTGTDATVDVPDAPVAANDGGKEATLTTDDAPTTAITTTPSTPADAVAAAASLPSTLHLIDGGVFANNPTLCAYAKAQQMTIGGKQKHHRVHLRDMFILSLSCGEQKCAYNAATASKWGKLGWAMPLINIMMDGNSATVDYQLRELFNGIGVPEQYIRLDPPLTKSSDALDDCSPANLKNLHEDLEAFLALPETQAALEHTVDMLLNGTTPHLTPKSQRGSVIPKAQP